MRTKLIWAAVTLLLLASATVAFLEHRRVKFPITEWSTMRWSNAAPSNIYGLAVCAGPPQFIPAAEHSIRFKLTSAVVPKEKRFKFTRIPWITSDCSLLVAKRISDDNLDYLVRKAKHDVALLASLSSPVILTLPYAKNSWENPETLLTESLKIKLWAFMDLDDSFSASKNELFEVDSDSIDWAYSVRELFAGVPYERIITEPEFAELGYGVNEIGTITGGTFDTQSIFAFAIRYEVENG